MRKHLSGKADPNTQFPKKMLNFIATSIELLHSSLRLKILNLKNLSLIFISLLFLFACKKEDPNDPATPDPVVDQIFDIVGSYEMNYGPHALAVSGDYVFASRDDKIYVVNLSDPKNPNLVATINDLTATNDFESLLIEGNILYAGCTTTYGIYMYDISNPSSPQALGKFTDDIYAGNKLKPLGLFFTNGTLWASGSNGLNALLVKFTQQNNVLTVAEYWVSATTGNTAEGLWANNTHAYISTADGHVMSFDLTNLAAGPLDDFTFQAEAGHEHWGRTLVGLNKTLYWADWGAGLVTIDITSPSNLTAPKIITHSSYIGQHPTAEGTNVYDVIIDPTQGKLYAANGWSGLLEVNLTSTDRVERFVDYKDNLYYCIALYGDYAILGDIAAGTTDFNGLKVIKIK